MTTRRNDKKTGKVDEADGQSFEKSLERLEKIVSEMEGGALSLEDMIGRFEEGQGLIKFCTRKLNEVERKIEILVKKGDDVEALPFDESDAEENVKDEPEKHAEKKKDKDTENDSIPF